MAETTEIVVPQGMHIEQTGPERAPEEPAENQPVPNPGDEIRRRIAERYEREQRGHELQLAEIMAEEAREHAAALDPAPDPAPEPPAETIAEPEPAAPPPNVAAPEDTPEVLPAKRTISFNGQNIEISDDELIRLAQTGLHTVQQMARPPAAAAAAPPAEPAPEPAPGAPDIIDDAMAKELARRISYGSEDEQAKAVKDLATTVAAQLAGRTLAPQQIAHVAKEQAKAEIRFEQNLETIGSEFPDIFKDDELTLLAAKKVGELRQTQFVLAQVAAAQGRRPEIKPDLALYREACGYVKAKYGAPTSQASTPQTTSVQAVPTPVATSTERLERKRAAPKPPAAANAKLTMPEAPRPPSGSDIVEMMRKQRGQLSMR